MYGAGGVETVEARVERPDAGQLELEHRFGLLVSSHRERARRLAWRLVGGDAEAAEDITQDAFVRAYQKLGTFRHQARLETWFYRILVRQAQTYRRWRAVRDRWRQVWHPPSSEHVPQLSGTAPEDTDPFVRRRIAEALGRLSRSQREAFVLVHLEGFTVRECAELMGKPSGTVKSHLHRALSHLRTELADLSPLGAGPTTEHDR